jgi:hypothetical protein
VVLSVAVGAKQKTFLGFDLDGVPIAVGERSCIQLKGLRTGLAMVKLERSQVSGVAADHATTTQLQHQFELPDPASLQLLAVALMMVVRVSVLAVS